MLALQLALSFIGRTGIKHLLTANLTSNHSSDPAELQSVVCTANWAAKCNMNS